MLLKNTGEDSVNNKHHLPGQNEKKMIDKDGKPKILS